MSINLDGLHYMAAHDDLVGLKKAQASGSNIHEIDKYGQSLLYVAALNSALNVAEYLIQQGASVNPKNSSDLMPLHAACMASNIKMFQFLLKHGTDINLKDNKGNTVLHRIVGVVGPAAWKLELIKYIVEDLHVPLDIANFEGNTPLFVATSKIIPYLIEKGANIKYKNKYGDTPWLYLSKNYFDFFDFRKELLRKVGCLLGFGADINSQDDSGKTALHYAAECGYADIVSLLLSKGAKKDIKNKEGKIPYEICKHKKIKNLLKP